MPRRKHTDPPVAVKVNLPESLYTKVSLLLLDPVRGKRRYAGLSQVVTQLLQKWVRDQTEEEKL